ncbi:MULTISPECIES: isocitrate lyase/phosphoenolpyruvate mutase family protein [Pseudomonas]|uniref:isocitrate lyase/PEP mutase family protein n=1 Tax=Pseudomonas TaxID=286 RepID=UPI00048060A6|nr:MULTISPECIES: isocitrate lyase/phosphoenolpyruvate mutase family protein [Pseudomonas]PRA52048.1 isocitrate lyase/phosphoenolpyruvate mutase family protein [Pseudomonas sp. MYb115]QXN51293.1 isocitrate lyase/phosphoenolpyruvate mutase family protein [Pseudomonas fluorescens]WSO25611.1 isocitrate lyase/phosphoenolpyruvate mutase family protein [Pseudomonas fluorescens]
MDAQTRKAHAFKALHEGAGVFVIPNPWDAGSAKMLASLGYQALATTSAGCAFSMARADGALKLDDTLANVRAIVAASDLPVAVDLENGFADDPKQSAASLLAAAGAGAVGGSIEDATGREEGPIYCFEHAVARIEAAVAAARSLPFPFILTARAENYLHGKPDLADTIRRLQAFAEAGADVLYAPGLRNAEEVLAVVRAVAPKPVNVLMSGGLKLTVAQLAEMGVKRISVGSAMALAAYGEFFRAAQEIRDHGTFGFTERSMPFAQANQLFKG